MRVGAGSKADPKLFEVFGTLLWSRFVRSLLLSCSMSTSAAPVRSGEHTRHPPDPLLAPQDQPKARRQRSIKRFPYQLTRDFHDGRARHLAYLDETCHVSESSSTHTRATKHRTLRPPLRPRSKTAPPRVIPPGKRARTRGHPKEYPFVTLAHYIAVLL